MPDDNDLLAQLNGQAPAPDANALPPFVDGAGAPAPTRDAELTVLPPARPNPIAAADSVHATVAGGAGYAVKVAGTYYANNPDGKGKIKKPFEHEFNVPRLDACLSLIKNKLLKAALKKIDPAFAADRECRIVGYRPLGASPKSSNLAYMNREDLEAFAQEQRIPLDLASFSKDAAGVSELRESIIDFVQNPDPVRKDDKGRNTVRPGDPGTFLFREKERQEKRVEAAELRRLNPGLEVAA